MRVALVIVCVAGCNQAFDLKPTRSVDATGADIDGDGVADANDNCPTLANPDQANTDGDAFGDACDSCPVTASTSVHDEDRDRVGDDCDACPGTPDFNVDEDSDGVGDLCDPITGAAPNHRVVFEPFVTMPTDWRAGTVPWTQAGDAIAPDTLLTAGDPGLLNTQISTSGVWMATVGFESRTHWDKTDSYGIVAATANHRVECTVRCTSNTGDTATSCVGTAAADGLAVVTIAIVPQPSAHLTIAVTIPGSATCAFGTGYSFGTGVFATDGMQISIKASPRVRASYFDYIQ